MRFIYSLLLYLLSPLFVVHLVWRGMRARAYWRRWPERFGFFSWDEVRAPVWVHAVSVGEVQASVPLIRALRERHPDVPVLVTTMTPTGSQRIRKALGDGVAHVYAPYDLPGTVARFLHRVRPRLALIMETEIWPNIFHVCRQSGVPVILANARMSERSASAYRKVHRLAQVTLSEVSAIAAQTSLDAERLVGLGAPAQRVHVTGSVKFDVKLPASLHEQAAVLRREWGVDRPVWIAASTHSGEDEIVLDAHEEIQRALPNALLVLVPRHPERFGKVAALCRRRGYQTVQRTEAAACTEHTDVFVGDTMGELPLFYAAADVAFVGGSLVPNGGQNPLEPAALGLPLLVGPHFFNFQEIVEMLIAAGGATEVRDASDVAAVLRAFLKDANHRHAAGEKARAVVGQNRGALQTLLGLLEEHLAAGAQQD